MHMFNSVYHIITIKRLINPVQTLSICFFPEWLQNVVFFVKILVLEFMN